MNAKWEWQRKNKNREFGSAFYGMELVCLCGRLLRGSVSIYAHGGGT